MREDVGLVEMEDVDHVRIGQRFEEDKILVVIPSCSGRDDRVPWCGSADRGGQLRFHSIPPVSIFEFRLVEDFEEDALRIPRRVMLRHHAPEVGVTLDKFVLLSQPLFEVRVGMHINLHGEAGIHNHLHGIVEIAEVFRRAVRVADCIHHRLRIYAQPDVIEPHGLDQGNVGSSVPG